MKCTPYPPPQSKWHLIKPFDLQKLFSPHQKQWRNKQISSRAIGFNYCIMYTEQKEKTGQDAETMKKNY